MFVVGEKEKIAIYKDNITSIQMLTKNGKFILSIVTKDMKTYSVNFTSYVESLKGFEDAVKQLES